MSPPASPITGGWFRSRLSGDGSPPKSPDARPESPFSLGGLAARSRDARLEDLADPLTLALSTDGVSFDRAFALRWGAPERRFPGSHKDYGFAYPGAFVDGGTLWVVCESLESFVDPR